MKKYKFELCENEIQCNDKTIAYLDPSIFEIETVSEFKKAAIDLADESYELVFRANEYSKLQENLAVVEKALHRIYILNYEWDFKQPGLIEAGDVAKEALSKIQSKEKE